jgi:hypothetical protein
LGNAFAKVNILSIWLDALRTLSLQSELRLIDRWLKVCGHSGISESRSCLGLPGVPAFISRVSQQIFFKGPFLILPF